MYEKWESKEIAYVDGFGTGYQVRRAFWDDEKQKSMLWIVFAFIAGVGAGFTVGYLW